MTLSALPSIDGHSPALDNLVERAGHLYTLPAVALKVIELTNRPQVDLRELKACLEHDPALTVKVLRVVNSSLFGLSRPVNDLGQALSLLGTTPLKLLVLGFSLPETLLADIETNLLARYWRRTLTKAVAARAISETFWKAPGDEAFLAGLLQDLGQLVLLQNLGEPYARLLDAVDQSQSDLLPLERRAMGFDHVQLTSRMLQQWGLAETLVRALGRSHEIEVLPDLPADERTLPQVLGLAELVAAMLADRRTSVLADLMEAGRTTRGLLPQDWELLLGRMEGLVSQLAGVLSLTLPRDTNYNAILRQAHEQLSAVAFDAARKLVRRDDEGPVGDSVSHSCGDHVQALSAVVGQLASRGEASIPAAPRRREPAHREPAFDASSGDEAGLRQRLTTAAVRCREERTTLSLMLVELDRFQDLLFERGPQTVCDLLDRLEALCGQADQRQLQCLRVAESRLAVVLPDCDRQAAVKLGNQLRTAARNEGGAHTSRSGWRFSLSVGIAAVNVPPKSFPPDDLVNSADRCLRGAQASGGDSLKSIEIY